jgi:hypothetical protein
VTSPHLQHPQPAPKTTFFGQGYPKIILIGRTVSRTAMIATSLLQQLPQFAADFRLSLDNRIFFPQLIQFLLFFVVEWAAGKASQLQFLKALPLSALRTLPVCGDPRRQYGFLVVLSAAQLSSSTGRR